jgi:hypothetical protein
MTSANLIVITRRIVVTSYRRFGTTYRSHLKGQELVAISNRRFVTTLEVGSEMLSKSVGMKLPQHAL